METDRKIMLGALCVTALMLTVMAVGGIIGSVAYDGKDDVPKWAKDKAAELEKNGGSIDIYNTGASTYAYTYGHISVGKGSKVIADSTGLTVVNGNSAAHYPYDRIAYISINTVSS